MIDLHGIVYAFNSFPELGPLQLPRTSAGLPFGGRYRLIDFSLSAMTNCGIRDVSVIMQKDYQSLLDHLRGGKEWDLSRRDGGLRMLPPLALPSSLTGDYRGCMEAMANVRASLSDIRQKYVLITRGDLVANMDFAAVYEHHVRSGAGITAVCTETVPGHRHHRYLVDDKGMAADILCTQSGDTGGVTATEVYVIDKDILLQLVDYCSAHRLPHFHRDAVKYYFSTGGKISVYMHCGFCRSVSSVQSYFKTSMELLNKEVRADLFAPVRPVCTREQADVSTYYGEKAYARGSLVADGCHIEGQLENCIVFRGAVIEPGAKLKNCIIMQDTVIGRNSNLTNLIADKDVVITDGMTLAGSYDLPLIVPKGTRL